MEKKLSNSIPKEDLLKIFAETIDNLSTEVHIWRVVRDERHEIKTWKLVFANPMALQSWGKELAEVEGLTTEEIFPSVDAVNVFLPIVNKIFAEGKPHQWEEFFAGTNQTLSMTSIPIGEYFISTGLDVSAKRETEKFIEQAHKLNSLGAIAGGVVHDINNFIAIIQANATFIDEYHNVDGFKDRIGSIINSCDKASALLGLILNFGSGNEVVEKLNMNIKVHNTLNILKTSIGKNIKISFKEAEPAPYISGNRIQVSQIIFNVANNALRSMQGQEGCLAFEAEHVQVSQDQIPSDVKNVNPGAFIRLRISDTGTGIDSQTINHIFKPFFTRCKDGKGSGLGLSIVDSILKKHHGFVTVESAVGKGTHFNLYFPAFQS